MDKPADGLRFLTTKIETLAWRAQMHRRTVRERTMIAASIEPGDLRSDQEDTTLLITPADPKSMPVTLGGQIARAVIALAQGAQTARIFLSDGRSLDENMIRLALATWLGPDAAFQVDRGIGEVWHQFTHSRYRIEEGEMLTFTSGEVCLAPDDRLLNQAGAYDALRRNRERYQGPIVVWDLRWGRA